MKLTSVFTEISHRLKKPQSQGLEEQVTLVDPVEVVWIVLDEAVQFSLDPVALVFFFNKEVLLHEFWHLVTQFLIFPFQLNQIIWLQGHQYWGLLCQLRMPHRSQQFLGNECSGAGSSDISDCFVTSMLAILLQFVHKQRCGS